MRMIYLSPLKIIQPIQYSVPFDSGKSFTFINSYFFFVQMIIAIILSQYYFHENKLTFFFSFENLLVNTHVSDMKLY